mgnify:CR=1 FL=1
MAPQSYYLGGKIRAIDFNVFINNINEIVGIGANDSGYGQGNLVTTQILSGAKVRASDWDSLLTAIHHAAAHQGTTVSVPTSVADPAFPSVSRIISIIPDLELDIENVRLNKLNSDIAFMELNNGTGTSKSYVDPATGSPSWQDTVYWEFTVAFTDEDARRHYFNTGSEIRIDAALTSYDAGNLQSLDWANLLSDIGSIKLSHSQTVSSESVGTPGIGFNLLTSVYQLVYSKGGTGDYSGNQINIYAKLNSTDSIDIRVDFDDVHTTDPSNLTDYVDGTLTIQSNVYKPDGTYITITDPTFSHIQEL